MLKNTEALFVERLKNNQIEQERDITVEIYYLYYTLAFLHKYLGEEDMTQEYCI